MTKYDKFHSQIKHIDIQHHFIRELVEQNKMFIDYINTKNMLADEFTKTLRKPKFENHQAKLGMTLTKEDVIAEVKGWCAMS